MGNLLRTVPDEESSGVVTAAWECGVRYFDGAPALWAGDPTSSEPHGRAASDPSRWHTVRSNILCLNCARRKARNLNYLVRAPPVGLEPTTLRLTVECSAN
jgi:hypothetical protein